MDKGNLKPPQAKYEKENPSTPRRAWPVVHTLLPHGENSDEMVTCIFAEVYRNPTPKCKSRDKFLSKIVPASLMVDNCWAKARKVRMTSGKRILVA